MKDDINNKNIIIDFNNYINNHRCQREDATHYIMTKNGGNFKFREKIMKNF